MILVSDTLPLKITLSQLAVVSTGFPQIPKTELDDSDLVDVSMHPALGLRSITSDGDIDFQRLDFVRPPQSNVWRQKLRDVEVMAGDVIAAARGSSGKAGLVRITPAQPLLSTNNVLLIRPKPDRLYPAYLQAYLQSLYDNPDAGELRRGMLSQWSITRSDLENLEIDLPPMKQQVQIAAAFDALVEARRAAKAVSDHYGHLLQNLSLTYFKHSKRS